MNSIGLDKRKSEKLAAKLNDLLADYMKKGTGKQRSK